MQRDPLYTYDDLKQMQALPLDRKIQISQTRIIEWILKNDEKVYVAFSGGKDSTVLLELVRMVNREIPAVFSNTGLEYPEIRKFALSHENVVEVRPEIPFNSVLTKYGYPLLSKDISGNIFKARKPDTGANYKLNLLGKSYFYRDGDYSLSRYNIPQYMPIYYLPIRISAKCCEVMKEKPLRKWGAENNRVPFMGTMAQESFRRMKAWRYLGCNAFDASEPRSAPLSVWTEQDVLKYILEYKVEICSVYGSIVPVFGKTKEEACKPPMLKCTGCQRTGCIFCAYGLHLDHSGRNRFQSLAKTHPKLYNYCMRGGRWIDNPDYDATIPKRNKEIPELFNWNPKKIWVPSSNGLGYKVMFDMVNSAMGKDFIQYD